MWAVRRYAALAIYDPRQDGYVLTDERRCGATWASGAVDAPAGSVCGRNANEQVSDVWLCEHHAQRVHDWLDDQARRMNRRVVLCRLDDSPPPDMKPKKSVVYFVYRDGFVKIGTTTRLRARLAAISRGGQMPDGMTVGPVSLLATLPGGKTNERYLHLRFGEHRIPRSEWFYPAPELMDFIRGLKGAQVDAITAVA